MYKNYYRKSNLTQVPEAYCHWLTNEARSEITNFVRSHPRAVDATRALIINAIKPAANTRKKEYFVYKLKCMRNTWQMVAYMNNSVKRAKRTPAYNYNYLYK